MFFLRRVLIDPWESAPKNPLYFSLFFLSYILFRYSAYEMLLHADILPLTVFPHSLCLLRFCVFVYALPKKIPDVRLQSDRSFTCDSLQ